MDIQQALMLIEQYVTSLQAEDLSKAEFLSRVAYARHFSAGESP